LKEQSKNRGRQINKQQQQQQELNFNFLPGAINYAWTSSSTCKLILFIKLPSTDAT
jgi:hypothetical protein